jgi:hypothetical protein
MSADAEVNAYLQVIGQKDPQKWSVFYSAEKLYWAAEYKGVIPPCKINLEIGGQFVYMQVNLGDIRVHSECSPSLWYYLLRLNEDLPIVKFGMLENGMIVLMAELPLEMLSLNSFETIIRLVTEVFAQYRREIELLASDHELANIILSQKIVERPTVVIKNS